MSEAIVWGCFAVFLGLRLLNPEIYWGEKPMDFSFLNALYRTTTLPPPEPWFAGSALHYTYFGHFLVAAMRARPRRSPRRSCSTSASAWRRRCWPPRPWRPAP